MIMHYECIMRLTNTRGVTPLAHWGPTKLIARPFAVVVAASGRNSRAWRFPCCDRVVSVPRHAIDRATTLLGCVLAQVRLSMASPPPARLAWPVRLGRGPPLLRRCEQRRSR
jgi:hypothetical protein